MVDREVSLHFNFGHVFDASYAYIRKNACSSFIRMILDDVSRSPEDVGKTRIGLANKYRRVHSIDELNSYPRRFFVFRPPLERVVSAFLSRVVLANVSTLGKRTVAASNIKFDKKIIENYTFEEFVIEYLIPTPNEDLDPHLRTVVSHLYPVLYTDVMLMSELFEDTKYVFGTEIADKFFRKRTNSTIKYATYKDKFAGKKKIREILSVYQESNTLPEKNSFLSANISNLLESKYSFDIELYNLYQKIRKEKGNIPVPIDLTNYDFSQIM